MQILFNEMKLRGTEGTVMKKQQEIITETYRELQDSHHKVLHELADAAQIIKSYEYLEKKYKEENAFLENVLANADKLSKSRNFQSFKKRKTNLQHAIEEYKSIKNGCAI